MCHSSLIKLKMPFLSELRPRKIQSRCDLSKSFIQTMSAIKREKQKQPTEFQEEDFETPRSTT